MSDTQLRRFLAPRLFLGFFRPTHVTAGAIPRMPCSTTEMLVDVSEGFSTDLLRGSLSVCSVSRRLQYDFISACISVYII